MDIQAQSDLIHKVQRLSMLGFTTEDIATQTGFCLSPEEIQGICASVKNKLGGFPLEESISASMHEDKLTEEIAQSSPQAFDVMLSLLSEDVSSSVRLKTAQHLLALSGISPVKKKINFNARISAEDMQKLKTRAAAALTGSFDVCYSN